MIDHTQLTAWMSGYLRAWTSNDREDIESLFTADAVYRTSPFTEPWVGHDQIVAGWLEGLDEPGTWEFEWHPRIESADLAVIEGVARYQDGRTYSNLWVIDLDDAGLCRDYTEWYMRQP
ncbi:MAG: nuclear transport factor 2 family protein [Burkholderiaceae bacterium]|nr:nuclear transport factor 2 family protein [Microbacteriaceae bacterium]